MIDWIIGTGVAVSLLIVLVLIVRRPFAKMFGAKAAYALWLLPFIRLVMPEVTIPRIFPRVADNTPPETSLPIDIVLTPEMLTALQAEPSLMSQVELYNLPTILILWIFGAVFVFFYHWTRQASYMDRLRHASEPATEIRHAITFAAKATGLKRIPQVRISDEKAGPLVAGFLRPVVILPDNFMTAFNPQQRHYALMHEFMHIKRGDVWVALAWLGFRAVNWPNPLVHYAAKHFRSDQEAACDASVLSAMGNTKEATAGYAETLIHAAKTAMTSDKENGRASPQPSALALTIHHPLKERLMILGTHRKTSNWRSRIAAAVMIIGAATLSAPLIQADAHPEKQRAEEELAGKHEAKTSTSVIKRMIEIDGKKTSEHFEIKVDGDDVKAFKVGPLGKKTPIDVKDIQGTDGANIIMATIEGVDVPKPPKPPAFTSHAENVFVFESDDLKSLKSLELLQGLEGLEKLKALSELKGLEGLKGLEKLKNLENFEIHSFTMDDESHEVRLKMRMMESKLAAARSILEDTEVEASDSREMAKAKRELEKARKALKAAEKALKEAE